MDSTFKLGEIKFIHVKYRMFIHVEHRMFQELSFFLSNTIYYFWSTINPLHPNISMLILLTVLNKFPYVLAGRIWLTVKRFFSLLLLPLFS